MQKKNRFTLGHTAKDAALLLLFLWAAISIVYHVILPVAGIHLSYIDSPLLTTAYFLTWSAVLLILYPHTLKKAIFTQQLGAYAGLLAFTGFLAFFYGAIVPMFPVHEAVTYPLNNFIHPTDSFLWAKTSAILLQQCVIAALILLLASYWENLFFVSGVYAVVFGLTHMLLGFDVGLKFAFIFTAGAIASSLIFPYLILRVKNGIIYSYMLHWMFYVGLTLWFNL